MPKNDYICLTYMRQCEIRTILKLECLVVNKERFGEAMFGMLNQFSVKDACAEWRSRIEATHTLHASGRLVIDSESLSNSDAFLVPSLTKR